MCHNNVLRECEIGDQTTEVQSEKYQKKRTEALTYNDQHTIIINTVDM